MNMTWPFWKTEFGEASCWFRRPFQSHAGEHFSRAFVNTIPLLATVLPAKAQNKRGFGLQANLPKFWKLIDHNAKLSQVATGFRFTEGPVWHPAITQASQQF